MNYMLAVLHLWINNTDRQFSGFFTINRIGLCKYLVQYTTTLYVNGFLFHNFWNFPTVCFTKKMIISPKGATVDTTNIWPGELLFVEFSFYNAISVQGFTSMLTVVYAKTKVLWIFPNAYKQVPVRIIWFLLTKLKNENYACIVFILQLC